LGFAAGSGWGAGAGASPAHDVEKSMTPIKVMPIIRDKALSFMVYLLPVLANIIIYVVIMGNHY